MTMLVDDEGRPLGMVDPVAMRADAVRLAFRLAAVAGNEDAVDAVIQETVSSYGPRAAGPVFTAAARTLALDVVAGLLDVCDEIGVPARTKLTELAAAADS